MGQSKLLKEVLDQAGVPCDLEVLPVAGHGGKGFPTEKLNGMVLAFFEKTLKQYEKAQDTNYFTSLFDGKTLAGWTVRTGQATYTVEAGVVVGRTATEGPNTFLCTKRNYGNFELTLDVKCDPGLNSGI